MRTFEQMQKISDNKPQWLIVHHTGGTDSNPLAKTSHHTFEMVRDWHITGKKWENIGYHYFIDIKGKISQGRPDSYHGAHTPNYNTKSIGICLAGNFDVELPSQEQIKSLTKILVDLSEKYSIPTENIVPHRKFAKKTCYGNNLSDTWASDLIKEDYPLAKFSTMEILQELIRREK